MTTLIKQLNQKFGNLSKDTIKEIKRSNKKQLNSLTLHIFDIEKAITNTKNVYSDVIKKELPRFKEEFKNEIADGLDRGLAHA